MNTTTETQRRTPRDVISEEVFAVLGLIGPMSFTGLLLTVRTRPVILREALRYLVEDLWLVVYDETSGEYDIVGTDVIQDAPAAPHLTLIHGGA